MQNGASQSGSATAAYAGTPTFAMLGFTDHHASQTSETNTANGIQAGASKEPHPSSEPAMPAGEITLIQKHLRSQNGNIRRFLSSSSSTSPRTRNSGRFLSSSSSTSQALLRSMIIGRKSSGGEEDGTSEPQKVGKQNSRNGKRMVGEDSSEVAALVFMMHEAILAMQSPADIDAFAKRFTVEQLCSLLRMRGMIGVQALQGLFREPLQAADGSLRPPHQAYLAHHFLVQEHPTAAMHRGITSRYTDDKGEKQCDLFNPPLADQRRIHGIFGLGRANNLAKVEFKVCVFPYILQFKVLQSIACSKTSALFETVECEAILKAAWAKIKYRYIADCLIEIGLVGVLCDMTEKVRIGEIDTVGLIIFVTVLFKELVEEMWSGYVHRSNPADYLSSHKFMHWMRLFLSGFFCALHLQESPATVQRPVLAGVVIVQWFKLLARGRAFELLGPKLLPIINTLKAMGPFLVVLFFYVGAFLHAYWALSARPVGEVMTIGYRLGVMGDFVLEGGGASILEDDATMDVWLLAWFFICSSLLTLFMMNVVIGVLGESYDIEHDRARLSFLRSRAGICAEYSTRLWKLRRPVRLYNVLRRGLHLAQTSLPRCLLWLAATLPVTVCYGLLRCVVAEWNCYDYQGRYQGLDTAAPFLWLCVATEQQADNQDAEAGRMQILTTRIDHSLHKVQEITVHALQEAAAKRATDAAKIARIERMLEQLMARDTAPATANGNFNLKPGPACGAGTPLPVPAPAAGPKCPFSGMALPADAMAGMAGLDASGHGGHGARGPGQWQEGEAGGIAAAHLELEERAVAQPARADGRGPPSDILMYGPHVTSLEQMVVEDYGEEVWHAIKERAGLGELQDGDLVQSQRYDHEGVVVPLVRAATAELGVSEAAFYHAVGDFFVTKFLERNSWLDMLRTQGSSTLRQFMDRMDAVHLNVEKAYPQGLSPPSFKTEDAPDGVGFLLHYWSFRPGLWPMAAGQVEAVARVLYGEEVTAAVVRASEEAGVHYVLFHVRPGLCPGPETEVQDSHGGPGAEVEGGSEGQAEALQPKRPDECAKPTEKLLYGAWMAGMEQLVVKSFGRHAWHNVKKRAGLAEVEDGDFLKSQQYNQELFYKLAAAMSEELGMAGEEALEAVGESIVVDYLPQNGYLDLLRAQGSSLRAFLDSMDTMHAYLKREMLPGLAPPSFRTEDVRGGPGFLLHYWSWRPGLWPLAKGMVRASGRLLFSQETQLEVLRASEEAGVHYVLFHVAPPLRRDRKHLTTPLPSL